MDLITLNNGVEIPQVGLGTYLLEPDDAQAAVTFALDNGYTLIDTANVYVNERAVGRGMREIPNLDAGDKVTHDSFGLGTVVRVEGQGDRAMAHIDFGDGPPKRLLLRYAPVTKL